MTTPDPGDDSFHMIFTGNKIVAGTDIQSKLINASSDDGLTWSAGNIAFSAAGGDTAFDGYNVSQPAVLSDLADAAHPYKMWYVGNNPDANGNFHDRIGLAYQKQPDVGVAVGEGRGADPATPYWDSFVTLGAQGTAFDSMKVADLRPVDKPVAAGAWRYGFYTCTNAADFAERIGVKQSADGGLTWTDVADVAALIDVGPAGTFDAGGVACPAPVENPAGGWWALHTPLVPRRRHAQHRPARSARAPCPATRTATAPAGVVRRALRRRRPG